jgi:uncharacterized SAM-binding protein YcdF (DUF218 family)
VKSKRRLAIFGAIAICAAALLLVFSNRVLWSLGAMLDNSEPPQKADMIVVIGGDPRGNRILKAAELVREGYAPKVLVSGGGAYYGRHESDLAIDFAVEHYCPRDEFIPLRYPALSTVDEAAADIRQLRHLGVHKYLLVTSEYHTARAGRIFRREGRREGAGLEMHTVSAPDPYWQNGEWWKSREGRKLWFLEFAKTIADWFRI